MTADVPSGFVPAYRVRLQPLDSVHLRWVPEAACAQFADATPGFLREQVPRNWAHFCDSVTDNFRVISPKNFRVMT